MCRSEAGSDAAGTHASFIASTKEAVDAKRRREDVEAQIRLDEAARGNKREQRELERERSGAAMQANMNQMMQQNQQLMAAMMAQMAKMNK